MHCKTESSVCAVENGGKFEFFYRFFTHLKFTQAWHKVETLVGMVVTRCTVCRSWPGPFWKKNKIAVEFGIVYRLHIY